MMDFGSALRSLRHDLALSQGDMALAVETTQRHLSFLETGRSRPSHAMVTRIATHLSLSAAQRAMLFSASGHANPYPLRDRGSEEVTRHLDMIARQVLENWPFPGFVLDQDWTILRQNAAGRRMFGPFAPPDGTPPNMLEIFLNPAVRSLLMNWEEVNTGFYFRLQAAARRSERVALAFQAARARGEFDGIAGNLTGTAPIPVFIPFRFRLPNGAICTFTSLLGQLASVQDAQAEGFVIELLVPVDQLSLATMQAAFGKDAADFVIS